MTMEDQQFCLKWCDHHPNMLNHFGQFLRDGTLCDVTLACEGSTLKAHKLVLSASSSFFQELFLENPCTHPIVILPELKYVDIKALIDFMYNGWVNVMETQLTTLFRAAEVLKIKGLGEAHDLHHNAHSVIPDTMHTGSDAPLSKMHPSSLSEVADCSKNKSVLKETDVPEAKLKSNSDKSSLVDKCDSDEPKNESLIVFSKADVENNTNIDSLQNDDDIEPLVPTVMEQSMTTEEVEKEDDLLAPNVKMVQNTYYSEMDDSTDNDNTQTTAFEKSYEDFSPHLTLYSQDCQYASSGSLSLDVLHNVPKRGRKPGSRLCVVCKRIFNCESDLEEHMANHKDYKGHETEFHGEPDESEPNVSQVVSEKNLVKLPVSCSTCNSVLNTMSDAQSHLSMNPNCRTSQFKCLLCPKLFIWPATLIKHFREQHQGPGGTARVTQRLWYFCDICKKPLLSKHALFLHRSKFHGISGENISSESADNMCKRGRKQGTRVCRLCKRTFTSTTDYHSHLQTHHRNRALSCDAVEPVSSINESFSSTETESNSTQSVI